MDQTQKASLVKTKWAEVTKHITLMSDEELLQHITEKEAEHIAAQTALECVRHEIDRRRNDVKSRMLAIQTEEDRKYRPKPQDKLEFDRKNREEKVKLSKEEQAIQKMMSAGLDRETAEKMFSAAKGK